MVMESSGVLCAISNFHLFSKSITHFYLSLFFLVSRSSATKAMKLGKKGRDVDSFVDKLINEGEKVSSMSTGKQSSMMSAKSVSAVQHSR